MHAVHVFYGLSRQYAFDAHGFAIDVIGVPAAAYFLYVVHGLYRGTFRDWNSVSRRFDRTSAPAAGVPRRGATV